VTIWNGEPGLTRATLKYMEPVSTPMSWDDAGVTDMMATARTTSKLFNMMLGLCEFGLVGMFGVYSFCVCALLFSVAKMRFRWKKMAGR